MAGPLVAVYLDPGIPGRLPPSAADEFSLKRFSLVKKNEVIIIPPGAVATVLPAIPGPWELFAHRPL